LVDVALTVQAFFSTKDKLFRDGQFEALARQFRFPAAVFVDERLRLLSDQQIAEAWLRSRAAFISHHGVASVSSQVQEYEIKESGRSTSTVLWSQHCSKGILRGQVKVRYYLWHLGPGNFQIEMLEVLASRGVSLFGETTEALVLH
jgi:hypothetical protein